MTKQTITTSWEKVPSPPQPADLPEEFDIISGNTLIATIYCTCGSDENRCESNRNAEAIAAVPDMIEALKRALPWVAKITADGTHNKCAMPRDAEIALELVEAALRKAGQID